MPRPSRLRRFAVVSLVALGLALAWSTWQVARPWLDDLARVNPRETALMRLRAEAWAAAGQKVRLRQTWVAYEQIAPVLVQAVLIAEDDRFLRHAGFDLRMLKLAFSRNLEAGDAKYGASTITQQLAKNLYLYPQRSLWRKFNEGLLTLGLEASLSKRRILELYLNLVEWGRGVFGVEAAARHYYGCRARDLAAGQAARLAAMLPAPLRWDPRRPTPYLEARARRILGEMRQRGLGRLWR